MADKKISELDSVSIFSDNDNYVPIAQTDATRKTTILTFANYVLGKLGGVLWALTTKTTPVDADTITINDTEDSNSLKKLTISNLWTYISTKLYGYFNGLTSATTPLAGTETISITQSGTLKKVAINELSKVIKITTSSSFNIADYPIGYLLLVNNGATAINITLNSTDTDLRSVQKAGTANITFVAGSGRTKVDVNGTAILSGAKGSSATITSNGTEDILKIAND